MQVSASTMENIMEVSQKITNGITLWPSNSTSGYVYGETQNTISREYMHPYVHCSIIYDCQDMDAKQVSIKRQADKKAVAHMHKGKLLGQKQEWNLTIFTAEMDL